MAGPWFKEKQNLKISFQGTVFVLLVLPNEPQLYGSLREAEFVCPQQRSGRIT